MKQKPHISKTPSPNFDPKQLFVFNIPQNFESWEQLQNIELIFQDSKQYIKKIDFYQGSDSHMIVLDFNCPKKCMEVSESTYLPKLSTLPNNLKPYFNEKNPIRVVCGNRLRSEEIPKLFKSPVSDFYHNAIFYFYTSQQRQKGDYGRKIFSAEQIEGVKKLIREFLYAIGFTQKEDVKNAMRNFYEKTLIQNFEYHHYRILKYFFNQKNMQKILYSLQGYSKCKNGDLCCYFFDGNKENIRAHEENQCMYSGKMCERCGKIVLKLTEKRHSQYCFEPKSQENSENSEQKQEEEGEEEEQKLQKKDDYQINQEGKQGENQEQEYTNQMVVIQNFPGNRDLFDVKKLFEMYGPIENFSFKKEGQTGSVNFICRYQKIEDAVYVKRELEGTTINHHILDIQFYKSLEDLQMSRVYVQGLDTVDTTDIKNFIKKYGQVNEVKILKSQNNKKGICYVEFKQKDCAQKLINEIKGEKHSAIGKSVKYSKYSLEYLEQLNYYKQKKQFQQQQYQQHQQQQQQQQYQQQQQFVVFFQPPTPAINMFELNPYYQHQQQVPAYYNNNNSNQLLQGNCPNLLYVGERLKPVGQSSRYSTQSGKKQGSRRKFSGKNQQDFIKKLQFSEEKTNNNSKPKE